jgi:Na+/melibiose symporter-like transporter
VNWFWTHRYSLSGSVAAILYSTILLCVQVHDDDHQAWAFMAASSAFTTVLSIALLFTLLWTINKLKAYEEKQNPRLGSSDHRAVH